MKYIRIQDLKIKGFMSIGDIELDLGNQGLVRVSGVNNCDSFDSNGAGKSAIFEAILWAFKGETVKGIKKDDIINRYWDGYTEVEVNFEYNGSSYRIVRRRNHPDKNNQITYEVDGEDKSGATMTKTENIIDDTFSFLTTRLMQSIMILGQGLPAKFSSLTPSKRKSRLEDISDSAKVVDNLKKDFKQYINTKEKITSNLKKEKSSKETLIQNKEEEIEKHRNKIDEIENAEGYLSDEEEERIKDDLEDKVEEKDEVEEKINKLMSDKDSLESKIDKLEYKKQEEKDKIKEKKSRLKDLLSSEESVCYACGQVIEDESKAEEMIDDVKDELNQAKEMLGKIQDKIELLEGNIEELDSQISELNDDYTMYQVEVDNLRSMLDNQPDFDVGVDYLNKEIDSKKEDIDELEDGLEGIEEELEEEEEMLEVSKHLKRMVSREFRGYLLDGVISYINHKLEEYSDVLYENEDQLVKVELDGNNLDIFFGDRQYESLSGGERRRVDIAIQFVLRDLSVSEAGVGFNILVLDEIFDSLDESGIQNVLELIRKKNEDLESIYQISHRSDLFIPSDSEITVVKNNDGVSELEKSV